MRDLWFTFRTRRNIEYSTAIKMSGNITPDRLLNTLKVLLSPAGGIRSRDLETGG